MSQGFAIEVVYVDGRRERHELRAGRVTIGSSPEADVTITGVPELAPKHLLVMPRDLGFWVAAARGAETPVLLYGVPVEAQEVDLGAELDIGSLTIRIVEDEQRVKALEQKRRSFLWIALAASVAASVVVYAYFAVQEPAAPRAPAEAPALSDEGGAECGAEPGAAGSRARELAEAASSHWLRYRFDAQAGLRACRALTEAIACQELAGDRGSSGDISRFHRECWKDLEADYKSWKLGLQRALDAKDYEEAKRHVVRLQNLLEHRPGEYRDWLRRVRRYVDGKAKEDD